MFKKCYPLFIGVIILFLSGCKDLYTPDVESTDKVLVIEGFMSNNPGDTYIKLQYAVSYDTTDNEIPVTDASVIILDDLGNEHTLLPDSTNTYRNNNLYAETGRIYHLKITTAEGMVYESDTASLPKTFQQDSIYADNVVKQTLEVNSTGDYYKVITKGIETYVDLSSGTTEIPKCRYDVRVIVMYTYNIYSTTGPPTTVYCWKTFNPNDNINITSSKYVKTTGMVSDHSLGFFETDVYAYDTRSELNFYLHGWLLANTTYNLNSEAFQYYTDIKNQMEATGKIFDPIASQLVGNMHCISNSSKQAFGYFEVSTTQKSYYRYSSTKPLYLTSISKDTSWTREGESLNPPSFW